MARVLVVDDDPDFVEIARLILRSAGHDVAAASSGEMALAMVRESRPDVILLDVMMRGVLDGVYVAHSLEEGEKEHIPVIMVSSIASSPMAGMFPVGEYLPIDMWISKPIRPEELLRMVDRLTKPTQSSSGRSSDAVGSANGGDHGQAQDTGDR